MEVAVPFYSILLSPDKFIQTSYLMLIWMDCMYFLKSIDYCVRLTFVVFFKH